MWCAPRASSCPKTNCWTIVWGRNARETQAPVSASLFQATCAPLSAQKDRAPSPVQRRSAEAPKRLSLYGHHLALRLAKAQQSQACRRCMGSVLQPDRRVFSNSGPTRRKARPRMRYAWPKPLRLPGGVAGCIVHSCLEQQVPVEQNSTKPLLSSLAFSNRSQELPHAGPMPQWKVFFTPYAKERTQPSSMNKPRPATDRNHHQNGTHPPPAPKTSHNQPSSQKSVATTTRS